MKHIKIFEQFDDDPFGEEIEYDHNTSDIQVGDHVRLINPIGALYLDLTNSGHFINSDNKIGWNGVVRKVKMDFTGSIKLIDVSFVWYRADKFEKVN